MQRFETGIAYSFYGRATYHGLTVLDLERPSIRHERHKDKAGMALLVELACL